MHVCFVDDNESEIAEFRSFMESKGCAVSFTDWIDEGRNFFTEKDREADLVVVLDLFFNGELKGPTILRSLRMWRPDLPVVVLTAADSESLAQAMRWGATMPFTKASRQFEEFWGTIEQSSRATKSSSEKLKRALELANAPDARSQFAGLTACREIVASTRMHVSPLSGKYVHVTALHGEYAALRNLLDHGIRQDYIPLVNVLEELCDTCATLHNFEPISDVTKLRTWSTACKHLGRTDEVSKFGGACLASLDPSDQLLQELIDWQIRRANTLKQEPQVTLFSWLDAVAEHARLGAHVSLVLALRDRPVSGSIATSLVDRLGEGSPQAIVSRIEREFSRHSEPTVLTGISRGDPKGERISSVLMNVVDGRLGKGDAPLGTLLNTVPLIEQLSRWRSSTPGPWLQRQAATLAFLLHANARAEDARDACLAVALHDFPCDGDIGTTLCELLADTNAAQLVMTLERWIDDARNRGNGALLKELVGWAVSNRDRILRAPIQLSALEKLIACLVRSENVEAAVQFSIDALELGLKVLRVLRSKEFETTLSDLRSLLEYAKSHASGETLGYLDRLEHRLTAIAAGSFRQPGLLAGKRVAIVAGEDTGAGAEILGQYERGVSESLGASCKVIASGHSGAESGLENSIKSGGVDYLVLVTGSIAHATRDRMMLAYEKAVQTGQQIALVRVPDRVTSARAVISAIAESLKLPEDEFVSDA